MTLTLEEVEHIAVLARLRLTPEEKERFREQLSAILDHVAQLQSVDTSGIPPTSSVLPPQGLLRPHGILRPDQPQPGLTIEELLKNAPDTEANQFRVPPILE